MCTKLKPVGAVLLTLLKGNTVKLSAFSPGKPGYGQMQASREKINGISRLLPWK
jgi:hypothetical protein